MLSMLSIMWYPRDGLRYLRNQRGAETAEWIVIVAVLVIIALAVYGGPDGTLGAGLSAVIATIIAKIKAILA